MQENIANIVNRTLPVLPVIQVDKAEDILPIGEALIAGGINALEITLRTPAGLDAIKLAKKSLPDAIVCAGTVTNNEQLSRAVDAGAEFIVTPGMTEKLLSEAVKRKIELLPGIATPSELMLARDSGLTHVKLFPAAVVGGMAMLKAMGGPFPDVHFCPTGGLNAENFKDFLSLPNVFCVGGSWMVVSNEGRFDSQATTSAARAVADRLAS